MFEIEDLMVYNTIIIKSYINYQVDKYKQVGILLHLHQLT